MSEEYTPYADSTPMTIEAFKNRPCSLPFADPCYTPPKPEEIQQLCHIAGWSQRDVAMLTGAHYSEKGSTTVRRWRTAVESPQHRAIPYSAWRIMLIAAGVVSIEQDLKWVI